MNPFLQGILFGLMVAISLGPAFFAILQTSVNRGFKSGLFMAIGITLSDIVIILLTYLGISKIINNPDNKLIVGIIGGIILLVFGLVTFTRKPMIEDKPNPGETIKIPIKKANSLMHIIKGFFLNIANPFLIIFWMGVMSYVSTNYQFEPRIVMSFFSGTIMTIFGTDLIKSFVGNRIKRYLTSKILIWFNRIVGIILMASGVVLITRVLYEIYPW